MGIQSESTGISLAQQTSVSGIIGKLSFEFDETLARPVLDRMLDASADRSTHARSVFAAPGIALGWCVAADDDAVDAAGEAIGTNGRQNIRVPRSADGRARDGHAGGAQAARSHREFIDDDAAANEPLEYAVLVKAA